MDDRLAAYFKYRQDKTETRPADRLMNALREVESKPTKLKHNTPDHVPSTPDGNRPTVRAPKPKKYRSPSM